MNHCWQDRSAHILETYGWGSDEHCATYHDDYVSGTCMLEDGHDGAHEFTDDDAIAVTFSAGPS